MSPFQIADLILGGVPEQPSRDQLREALIAAVLAGMNEGPPTPSRATAESFVVRAREAKDRE